MAEEQAKVKFSADDREVERAWSRQFQQMSRLEQKLDQVGKTGRDAALGGMKSFTDWMNAAGMLQQAFQLVTAELERAREANRRFHEEQSRTTISGDRLFRKLYNQAGIGGNQNLAEQQSLKSQIYNIAGVYGVDRDIVARSATEAISQGMSLEQARTGGIQTIVQGLVGLNMEDASDPETIIKGLARGVTNSGGNVGQAKDWMKQIVIMQRAFKDTPLQAGDAARFAAESGMLTNMAGIDAPTQYSTLASLLGQFDAGTASTQYRNFVMSLKDAGKSPEAMKALGLKAEDVDFLGESQDQVIDRLAAAYQRTAANDPRAAEAALMQIFKKEGAAGAEHMIRNRDQIKGRRIGDLAAAEAAMLSDVEGKGRGDAVAVKRSEIRKQKTEDQVGAGLKDAVFNDLATIGRQKGWSNAEIEAVQQRYKVMLGVGVDDPLEAARQAMSGHVHWSETEGIANTWIPAMRATVFGEGNRDAIINQIADLNRALIDEIRMLREQQAQPQIVRIDADGKQLPGKKVTP